MANDKIKLIYNTVLSQTISTCGDYLFAGNNYGEIFVFSINQICNGPAATDYGIDSTKNTTPIQIFKLSESCPVYSLAFYKNFLIVGTTAKICGYTWSKNEITKKAWEIKISGNREQLLELADVNSLWLDKIAGNLYAGCGDNVIYEMNLEDGQIVRDYTGHKDYIHCVHGSGSRIFSASEDGTVKFWDYRQKRVAGQIEPYTNADLVRPNFGKWQGTVSVTDDWLVCGGGPKFSLWHLRSMECTTVYPFPEKIHVSGFLDDILYTAGDLNSLHQYSLAGDIMAEVPISSSSAYSVVWQIPPNNKILSIGGASNSLDICTNFNYKDIVIDLYT